MITRNSIEKDFLSEYSGWYIKNVVVSDGDYIVQAFPSKDCVGNTYGSSVFKKIGNSFRPMAGFDGMVALDNGKPLK